MRVKSRAVTQQVGVAGDKLLSQTEMRSSELAPALGLEPMSEESPNAAETKQNSAKLLQFSELASTTSTSISRSPHLVQGKIFRGP